MGWLYKEYFGGGGDEGFRGFKSETICMWIERKLRNIIRSARSLYKKFDK